MKYPVGTRGKPSHIKVAVTFPDQLFMDIIAMARRDNKDFSEMVTELCKVGKLDLEESDALEPAA